LRCIDAYFVTSLHLPTLALIESPGHKFCSAEVLPHCGNFLHTTLCSHQLCSNAEICRHLRATPHTSAHHISRLSQVAFKVLVLELYSDPHVCPPADFTSTAGNAVSRRVGSGGVRWNVTWVADKEEAGQREGEGAGEAEADLILEVHLCCQRSLAERAVNEDPANRLQP
jgi:hypothetical protein